MPASARRSRPQSDGPFTGLVLANEVADALPVHRVVQRGAELLEVRVGLDGDRFVDVETAPSTPDLFVRLAAEGVTLADGQRGEICLALDDWLAEASPASSAASRSSSTTAIPPPSCTTRSAAATARCGRYVRHTVHDDPYAHVGRQDLTAHVDVDAVVRAATDAGLAHLGTTTQAEFLVGLGMDEHLRAIQTDPATTMEAYLAVRSSVMRLLDPAATGRLPGHGLRTRLAGCAGRSRRPSACRFRLPGEVALTNHGRSSPRPIRHGGLQHLHPSPQTGPTSWGRAGWAWTNEDGKENARPSPSS